MTEATVTMDALPRAPLGMMGHGLEGFRGRRVLMLQGPIGPFFARLSRDLTACGAAVLKVNFNGGDLLFTLGGAFERVLNYRGDMIDWPATFERFVAEQRIDTILLFGDCRPVHVPAVAIAKRLGIEVGVFEEGYLRPDYITIERGGVNNHSPLPKDPRFYRSIPVVPAKDTVSPGRTFAATVRWGALYYLAASLCLPAFRHYWHHRPLGVTECRFWIRSFWRKLRYRIAEQPTEHLFVGPDPAPYFLVPLQTCGDAQVRVHSTFRTVPRFIEHVMRSFAENAPAGTLLVIKHHPLDRGFTDHRRLIECLAEALEIGGRCYYIHDQHLPTLIRQAIGVVTINSTVGLSAVGEGAPVAVCGDAIYDIPGLTFQQPLSKFWTEAERSRPDPQLWQGFRSFLIASTQFNGSFYRPIEQAANASGVFWDPREAIVAPDPQTGPAAPDATPDAAPDAVSPLPTPPVREPACDLIASAADA